MSSEVDICNLALSRLGDNATVASIDPPEGSAQAEHCARFYPIARDSLLEMHTWKFATRRATLAELDVETFNWEYAYVEPSGCLRVLKVLAATDLSTAESQTFETESDEDGNSLIRTDLPEAVAYYTARVTDTTKFSPLFVDALGWLLASHLAGLVIKGDQGRAEAQRCNQMFYGVVRHAMQSDANQRQIDIPHTPGWLEARGVSDTIFTADGRIIR